MDKVLVTGGAGFIGSHLVDRLLKDGQQVVVLDNLSAGNLKNLDMKNQSLTFVKGDLLSTGDIENALKGVCKVYHVAANPDVRTGESDPKAHFTQNTIATYNLLEYMKKIGIKDIIFTSTSAVYGDAKMPTTEEQPAMPISIYGASKVAAEGLISSFCHTFAMRSVILRFANVIGPRSNHGVIWDFTNRLIKNPKELQILGDGTQSKSYLYVDDCIDAIVFAENNSKEAVGIFNVGSEDRVCVKDLAGIVTDSLGLKDVKYVFTGGDEGRGWKGDVKFMQLSIDRIKRLGWKPKLNSRQAIEETVKN